MEKYSDMNKFKNNVYNDCYSHVKGGRATHYSERDNLATTAEMEINQKNHNKNTNVSNISFEANKQPI